MNRLSRNVFRGRVAHRQRRRGHDGFTLTELLVTVALIALLMGLLLPALHTARKKAIRMQCSAHLVSLGRGMAMFTDEHEGSFPKVTKLDQTPQQVRRQIQPYVGDERVFQCWGDPNRPIPPGGSYDWRYLRDRNASLDHIRREQIRYPYKVAIGGDRHQGWHTPHAISVLFGDSHVEQVKEDIWFKEIKSPIRTW